ncbi:MAG: hypothetical protein ACRDSJ_04575 [Rubrobacteraceae bacterium]
MSERAAKNDPLKLKRRRAREKRSGKVIVFETRNGRSGDPKFAGEQPSPRLSVFSGGDPTLAERFEEELHKRKDDRPLF